MAGFPSNNDDGVLFEEELGCTPDSTTLSDGNASLQPDTSCGLIKQTFDVDGIQLSAAKCLCLVLNKQSISETSCNV
eukprot:15324581-Ditylum_brightwellii.AAC.1